MLSNEAKVLIGEDSKVPSLSAGEKFSEERNDRDESRRKNPEDRRHRNRNSRRGFVHVCQWRNERETPWCGRHIPWSQARDILTLKSFAQKLSILKSAEEIERALALTRFEIQTRSARRCCQKSLPRFWSLRGLGTIFTRHSNPKNS